MRTLKKLICMLLCAALLLPGAIPAGAELILELPLNTVTTVNIDVPGEHVFFSFTPAETAVYRFFSLATTSDVWADLYDADMNRLAYNDDGGPGNNFRLEAELTAGVSYYFSTHYNFEAQTGSYPVKLVRITDPGFSAQAKNGQAVFRVDPGSRVTLKVDAVSAEGREITYTWFKDAWANYGARITGETGASLTLENVTSTCFYYCRAQDELGSYADVTFTVYCVVPQPIELNAETTANIETRGDYAFFSFTPAETGLYRFFSRAQGPDVWADLFTPDLTRLAYNDDGGPGSDFRLEYELTAGETYYFSTHYNSASRTGSYPVKLVRITDPGFSAAAKDGRSVFRADPGSRVTLEVEAVSAAGREITYTWFRDSWANFGERLTGQTGASLTLENVTGTCFYYCRAMDELGSYADVTFTVFCAVPQPIELNVETTVTVETHGDYVFFSFTPAETGLYRFFSHAKGPDVWADLFTPDMTLLAFDDDSGPGSNFRLEYELTAGETYYYSTHYNNSSGIGSYPVKLVRITDPGFTAQAKNGETVLRVIAGHSLTLEVEAESAAGTALSYTWYRGAGALNTPVIPGETAASLTLENVTGTGNYCCRAEDELGSYADVVFTVYCLNPPPIALDAETPVDIETPGGSVSFLFTPEETGVYRIFSLAEEDVRCELFNAGMTRIAFDDDGGVDKNFRLDFALTAGETYCYSVRYSDDDAAGSFPVYLVRPQENGFSAARVSDEYTFVHAGETPVLEVTAACEKGRPRFFWKEGTAAGLIAGASGPAYKLLPVQKGAVYTCIVIDDYCNLEEIPLEVVNLDAISYVWSEDRTACTATYGDVSPAITENGVVTDNSTPPTCTEPGTALYIAEFTDPRFAAQTITEPLEPLGHAWGEPTYEWSEDNGECTASAICANDASHVISETAKTHYEVTSAPTCTESGVGVYTAAFNNKRFYGQRKEVEIPATGHDYGEPVYVWSEDYGECTAMVICANDASHVISETAQSEAEIKPATCTEPGLAVYTVGFVNKRFWGQRKEVELAPNGHAWGEPTYEWSEDLSECTAKVICANDASHVISETVKSNCEVTVKPSCTEPGLAVYTVGFNNKRFYGQSREVEIPASGHAYGEPVYVWSEDYRECTAMVICANDETHVISETAQSEAEIKPATCTEPGLAVYTVGFINKRFWGQRKEVELAPNGHAWGEPTYEWSEDLSECTAKVICANDETHVIGETAKSSCEVTVKPTCTEPGVAVYTVCFSSRRFYQQTKKAELPALGHDLVPHEAQAPTCTEPGWDAYETCSRCDYTTFTQIPAAGHTPGEPQRENETDTAYDEVVYCTVCGAELSRNTVSLAVFLPGDADADGQITASDARLALRRAVDLETYPEGSKEFIACDIDKDGSVTAGDARIILRIAVALESVEDYK